MASWRWASWLRREERGRDEREGEAQEIKMAAKS